MPTVQLGQVAATVFEKKVGKKPTDNVFLSQALLHLLKEGNGFRSLDGGRLIEETIEYAENTTFRSYADLETLDTTRIDVFDVARFEWKENGGTMVISNLEKMRRNPLSRRNNLSISLRLLYISRSYSHGAIRLDLGGTTGMKPKSKTNWRVSLPS